MAQTSTYHLGIGVAQVVGDELFIDDLGITVHEEEPFALCLIGQQVADTGASYVGAQLDETAVGEAIDCSVYLFILIHR